MSPKKLKNRLSLLMQDLRPVIDWADEVVAHTPEVPKKHELTFADINAAVDTVGDAHNSLSVLLLAQTCSWEPHFADDWKGPFRVPIFPRLEDDY